MAGTLEASIEAAVAVISAMNSTAEEYEETLTGTLLGSLLASNLILRLQSAHLDLPPDQCWWGSYSKYRGKDIEDTEAGSGADFALLVLPENEKPRLAIFQAKRGELLGDEWVFDATRIPQRAREPGKAARRSQMRMLVKTAARIHGMSSAADLTTAQSMSTAFAEPRTRAAIDLSQYRWIHYLIYSGQGTSCISLDRLEEAYWNEIKGRQRTIIALGIDSVPLTVLLQAALTSSPVGWLQFQSLEVALSAVPALLPLVPVIVGDGSGQVAPLLSNMPEMRKMELNILPGALTQLIQQIAATPGSKDYVGRRLS